MIHFALETNANVSFLILRALISCLDDVNWCARAHKMAFICEVQRTRSNCTLCMHLVIVCRSWRSYLKFNLMAGTASALPRSSLHSVWSAVVITTKWAKHFSHTNSKLNGRQWAQTPPKRKELRICAYNEWRRAHFPIANFANFL